MRASTFLPLALLLACGSSSSSSGEIEGLPPNASLAPSFNLSAPRTDGPMDVTGFLYVGEAAQVIPDGRLVVIAGETRTPLGPIPNAEKDDEHGYTASFAAAPETPVDVVLVREVDHVVGTVKIPAPISFTFATPSTVVTKDDQLTIDLSRPLASDERATLVVRGRCLPPVVIDKPTVTGTRAIFALDELSPFEASCEATVDLQVGREGTIGPAFSHDIQLRSGPLPAHFGASRLATKQLTIRVTDKK